MKQYLFGSKLVRISVAMFGVGILFGVGSIAIGQVVRGSSRFPDVPYGAYYDEAVGELNELGIINGYANGNFGPNDNVTRAQIAVLMKRLRDELTGGGVVTPVASSSSSRRSSSSSSSSSSQSVNTAGVVRFTSGALEISEDGGTLTLSLIRTGDNEGEVKVDYEINDKTAKGGDDYVDGHGTITFDDNEGEASINLRILDDADIEEDEEFIVKLKSPTGGLELGSVNEATITIIDNDAASGSSGAGEIFFSAVQYYALEDSGDFTIRVMRDSGTGGTVSVNYSTKNISVGKAITPADYMEKTGTVTFADGETEKTITFTINEDTKIEGNEYFQIRLENPTGGASIREAISTVMIMDSDMTSVKYGSGSFKFSKEEYDVGEDDGHVTLLIERTGGAAGDVGIRLKRTGGTASSGSDYEEMNKIIPFLQGESIKAVRVTIHTDKVMDDYETIIFRLSEPAGSSKLGSPIETIVTIIE